MFAYFRVSTELLKSRRRTRASLLALLSILLSSCSMLQEELPAGAGSIHGSVLSNDYSLELHALGSRSMQLAAATDRGEYSSTSMRAPLLSPVAAAASYLPGSYVPDEVLVQYKADSGDFTALSSRGRAESRRTDLIEIDPREGMAAALSRLSRDPDVLLASPNYYLYPTALPNDPYLVQQWSLPAAGLPATWDLDPGGDPVVVAVLDSGFELGHEDLSGIFLPGYDFCANSDCTATDTDPSNVDEANWHGTHVAGVVAAAGNNGLGVRGVATSESVRILPIKIFNDSGGGANTDILIKALRWSAGLSVEGAPPNDSPARIINLSLAGDFSSEIVQPVIDEVRATGALVAVSTGNNGFDRIMSPAAAAGVIAVGAINSDFGRSCFSNYGVGPNGPGGVDIVAPGGEANGSHVSCGIAPTETEGLMSTIPGNTYASAVGTSMAAPMVSGALALILGHEPGLNVDELETRLLESAYFDESYMSEMMYGAGVLRADKALGFVGPGDRVRLELTEESTGVSREIPLTLGLAHIGFGFDGIVAGRYDLRAEDPDTGSTFNRISLALSAGEDRLANIVLQTNP